MMYRFGSPPGWHPGVTKPCVSAPVMHKQKAGSKTLSLRMKELTSLYLSIYLYLNIQCTKSYNSVSTRYIHKLSEATQWDIQ